MRTKRFFSLLICTLLVLSLAWPALASATATELPDIAGHWAEEKIRQLFELEAITGYPDGTFQPENNISRAEFSSVLWGALELEEMEGGTFQDIEGHWAEGRIEALVSQGVIDSDVYEASYGPDEPITREEIAMMTVNILEPDSNQEENDMETYLPYEDVEEICSEFLDHVIRAYNEEIITGYPDNTFKPEGTATRAEASVMAVRSLRTAGIITDPEAKPGTIMAVEGILTGKIDGHTIEISIEDEPKAFTFQDDVPVGEFEAGDHIIFDYYENERLTITRMEKLEDKTELPGEIKEWVECSSSMLLAQDREYDGFLYLLVTYGEKPTSGYDVEITQVLETADEIVVSVEFTEPAEDEAVLQVLTYPYDKREIPAIDKPVRFVARGAQEYLPTLKGIDYLKPVVAQSEFIKVFSPAPESSVSDSFTIEGVANVFEGTVLYRLLDSGEEELDSGITSGYMGDWGYFEPELTVPGEIETGEELLLQLYTESAKDGRIENLVEIELELLR